MKAKQIIQKYHKKLLRELRCHKLPRFKIGEVVEVRKNVEHITHIGMAFKWIIWDEDRKEIEGRRAEIVDIDYTDDENSSDKEECIGYMIKVEGRRGNIAVHEESLKGVQK